MRVLLIGGTRFIGPFVVGRLVDLGHEVTIFHRGQTEPGDLPAVAEPAALTQREWLLAAGRFAGWHGEVIAVPQLLLPRHLQGGVAVPQDMDADSSRIRSELGYAERVPSDEWLGRAIEWERAHPPGVIKPHWVDYVLDDAALEAHRRATSK